MSIFWYDVRGRETSLTEVNRGRETSPTEVNRGRETSPTGVYNEIQRFSKGTKTIKKGEIF